MRLFLAGLLAASLLVGAAQAAAPKAPASPTPPNKISAAKFEETRVELRKMLIENSGGTYEVIRRAYPGEYAAFETELVRIYLDDEETGMDMQAFIAKFEGDISRRLTAGIKSAPAKDLVGLVRTQLSTMKVLQQAHYGACAELGEKGGVQPATSPYIGEGPRPILMAFSRQSLEVGLAGREHPTTHGKFTEADDAKLMAAFEGLGGNADYIGLLGAGRAAEATPEFRCQQIILYFEALLTQPDDLVVRFAIGR